MYTFRFQFHPLSIWYCLEHLFWAPLSFIVSLIRDLAPYVSLKTCLGLFLEVFYESPNLEEHMYCAIANWD